MRGFFLVVSFGILGLSGCGGGSSSQMPVTVYLTPTLGQSLGQGKSLNITATVSDAKGVTWNLSGPGLLINPTPFTVTYTAPNGIVANANAVVSATSLTTSSASTYLPLTVLPFNTFGNVQPVSVNGGPVPGQIYPNGAFTTVTICQPGTTNCFAVDGILVDTGSSGLRVLASALPSLPALTDASGNAVSECVQFVDHSYVWGNVDVADVRMGGEVAGSVSIHAIADPAGFAIPSDCTNNGAGTDDDNQRTLGANGILGVGLEPQDCGAACDPSAGGTPPGPAYYTCAGGSCKAAFVALAQQVTHPVTLFGLDNNGLALQLQTPAGVAATVDGAMVFGIGTKTNNVLGNATVFTVDSNDNLTTNLASTGQSLTASFLDSGSNALLFPDGNLAVCPGSESSFFCPPSTTPLTATIVGSNKAQSAINFSVGNADDLLNGNPGDAAFSNLAGPNGSGDCSNGSGACSFDWGLPFFYGRTVFAAINGQLPPVGAPAAPWWAYTIGF